MVEKEKGLNSANLTAATTRQHSQRSVNIPLALETSGMHCGDITVWGEGKGVMGRWRVAEKGSGGGEPSQLKVLPQTPKEPRLNSEP